ncbi:MAG: sigma-70 family RNA polymerase sigma factor [Elusimicrobia bacterium]|nr:sigma-70 family RNA polymerase sigma factor [Elusimicrobiota bacterium]
MKENPAEARKDDEGSAGTPPVDQAKAIVERYTPHAYALAFRLTGNQADAWDLAQNAMLRVLRSYSTYDPSYSMEQWLSRIVRNLFIDKKRSDQRRRESPLESGAEDDDRLFPADTLADPSDSPEDDAAKGDEAAVVRAAVAALPAETAMAVMLVDIEGRSYEEAARMLEIPVSTLGVRVFRGRKTLKERLKGYWEGRA